jgi:tocopherol O-methyltransferase
MTATAGVARHYDELDPFYREIWGEHLHHGLWRSPRDTPERAVEQLIDHVAAALVLSEGDTVIDVGAGYGATARYLASRYCVNVTGFTISAAQHAYAAQHPAEGVQVLLEDWHANGLADQSADAVLAIESTEHMADLPFALAELRRVLRPGRRAAICAWITRERPSAWERRALLDPIAREGRLVTFATASEQLRLIKAAGFTTVICEDLSAAVARTWTVCLRRVAWKLASDSRYSRYLLDSSKQERAFLATMLRIRVAYACGAMRYALFVGQA